METSPSEGDAAAETPPCPECGSVRGYSRVGKFRAQCLGCNALLKNAEINLSNEEK